MQRQSSPPRLIVGLVLMVAMVGCSRKASLDELVAKAETLAGVRNSRHSALREEFRAIELARKLPKDLNRRPVDEADNAAAALEGLLDASELERVEDTCGAVLTLLSDDPLNAAIGGYAAQAVEPWTVPLGQMEQRAARRACHFNIAYERGRFGDFRSITLARAGTRLLLVDSLQQQTRSLDEAISQLARAWRWIDWLMEERYLEAWLTAAELRIEALAIVDRLANDPRATAADRERLGKLLAASFERWPSVESALVRERAIDLHTYEAIRLGLVEMLFSTKERGELRVAGVLEKFANTGPDQIDADQAAYLTYMRRVIELSRQPFYAAKDKLVEADRLLGVHQGEATYPWFAIKLCTENLTLAQAELASDRARVEAWVIALAEAAGTPPAEAKVNPRTGKPYHVERDQEQIVVHLGDRKMPDPMVSIRD